MDVTLVELCAGSAALTRRLCGLGSLVGFMGSKDRYAAQILEAWGIPQPDVYVLNDPGYWGVIWRAYALGCFGAVADLIDSWATRDARGLFDHLRAHKDDGDLTHRAAARLCLLAGTYGGGEIGGFKGKHKLRSSVDGFIPSRPSLARRVRSFPPHDNITAWSRCATQINPVPGCWAYIDPPYSGQSGYEQKLPRPQVIDVALRWHDAGCHVAVSESVPLHTELGNGWQSRELPTVSGQYRKNARNTSEFLTYTHSKG
jgi:hypothetical protein